MNGEPALGAAVVLQLVEDIAAYDTYLQLNIRPTRRNKTNVERIIRNGADAVYCLHPNNQSMELWASLAGINPARLQETIIEQFPRAYTTIWRAGK